MKLYANDLSNSKIVEDLFKEWRVSIKEESEVHLVQYIVSSSVNVKKDSNIIPQPLDVQHCHTHKNFH